MHNKYFNEFGIDLKIDEFKIYNVPCYTSIILIVTASLENNVFKKRDIEIYNGIEYFSNCIVATLVTVSLIKSLLQ